MSRSVHVHAPCRLHFGMFTFGHADGWQFGGVGVMIEPPAVAVTISPSPAFSVSGTLPERVVKFVDKLTARWKLGTLPACKVHVEAPREHAGLGVGTQLALATAVGMQRFLGRKPKPIPNLSNALGRGARSWVGTIGFEHGGLIVDHGKFYPGVIGNPFMRQTLPDEWRFVLICSREQQGLAGFIEADAFARLPPVPKSVTAELQRITTDELTAAVAWKDCAAFGDAVYRFGLLAGECFAAVQGGPFANDETAKLVEAIRAHGVPGVGQSSWGPTVFAITANDYDATALARWLAERYPSSLHEITIARPNNTGAQVKTVS
jgi:beta-RFAP synthase